MLPILFLHILMDKQKQNLVFILTLLLTMSVASQNTFTAYLQPGIKVTNRVNEKYSQNFSIENRNIIYNNDTAMYEVKHIDFSHISNLHWTSEYAAGLGLKYRWENSFRPNKENELRLQEQVVYTPKNSAYKTAHRLRAEQRFYKSVTKHRFRYQLGYTFLLNAQKSSRPYIKASTESLYEVAKTQNPELDQRLSLGYGWWLGKQTSLQFGTEYQLKDYLEDVHHRLILTVDFGLKF